MQSFVVKILLAAGILALSCLASAQSTGYSYLGAWQPPTIYQSNTWYNKTAAFSGPSNATITTIQWQLQWNLNNGTDGIPSGIRCGLADNPCTIGEYESEWKRERRHAAHRVHEESSLQAKAAYDQAMAKRNNIVYDGVNGNPDKMKRMIADARANGYEVSARYIDKDIGEALKHMVARFEKTGRWVPGDILEKGHRDAAHTFHEISDLVDDARLYKANETGGSDLVYENGKVYNQGAFEEHLKKGGQDGRLGHDRQALGRTARVDAGNGQESPQAERSAGTPNPVGAGSPPSPAVGGLAHGEPEGRSPVRDLQGLPRNQSAAVEPEAGEKPAGEGRVSPVREPASGERDQPTAPRGEEQPADRPGAGGERNVPAGGANARRGRVSAGEGVGRRNADWFSHPDDFSIEAGTTKRLEWNLKALEIVKAVTSGERKLTDADRDALAHYVGWGALPNVFDPYKNWEMEICDAANHCKLLTSFTSDGNTSYFQGESATQTFTFYFRIPTAQTIVYNPSYIGVSANSWVQENYEY